jgi:hypothetical protein
MSNEHQSVTSTVKLPEINQLTIIDMFDVDNDQSFFDALGPILLTAQIRCLKITCRKIFIGTLIDLIRYLPNLHSLIVTYLAMVDPRCLLVEEATTLRFVSQNNKITRVNLQQMNDLAQVQFLLELCPRIEYLEVDCTNVVYPEDVIRFILMKNIKYIPNLSSLCLKIRPTKTDLVYHLKRMIDFEQLHQNYTIQQTENSIHFQWN